MGNAYVEIPQETLKKAHTCMVEILKEIDRICSKHQITWFLFAGTALGAVRHQGFIPWDDDCDIGMPRKDYEKFLEVAGKELPDTLFLQTKKSDPAYGRPMVKIRMNGTKLVEFDEKMNEKYHQGIFVDVFPYDYFPASAPFFCKLFNVMPRLRGKRKKYPRGDWRRVAIGILTAIPYVFHSMAEKLYVVYCHLLENDKASLISMEMKVNPGFFSKVEDILPVRRDISFENCYFPLPANPDAYLKAHYGNYMQLPSPEKRHTHAKLIEC